MTWSLVRRISRGGPSSVSSFSMPPAAFDEMRDARSLDLLAVLVDEGAGVVQPCGRGRRSLQPADRVAGGLALRAGRAERPTRRDAAATSAARASSARPRFAARRPCGCRAPGPGSRCSARTPDGPAGSRSTPCAGGTMTGTGAGSTTRAIGRAVRPGVAARRAGSASQPTSATAATPRRPPTRVPGEAAAGGARCAAAQAWWARRRAARGPAGEPAASGVIAAHGIADQVKGIPARHGARRPPSGAARNCARSPVSRARRPSIAETSLPFSLTISCPCASRAAASAAPLWPRAPGRSAIARCRSGSS